MWRYLILLLVASPLLYAAYHHGNTLVADYREHRSAATALSDETLDRCGSELEAAHKKAKTRGRPAPALMDCMLRVEHCPSVNADENEFTRTTLPPTRKYADELDQVRLLFGACADKIPDPGAVTNDKYKDVLRNLHEVGKLEGEMGVLLAEGDGMEKSLEDKLRELKQHPYRNPIVVREMESRIAKRKIVGLNVLPANVDKFLRGEKVADVSGTIEKVLTQLKDFQAKHANNPEDKEWAQAEIQRWDKTQRLINLFERNGNQDKPDKIQAHLEAYASLLTGSNPDATFRGWARRAAEHLCTGYLTDKLDLDSEVIINHGGKSFPEKRSKVTVQLKGKKDKVPLADVGDEFRMEGEPDRFYVGGVGPYDGPIEPTNRSKAVQLYNSERKKLRWSAASLDGLLKAIDKYSGELRPERQKAEALREAVSKHEELFGGK